MKGGAKAKYGQFPYQVSLFYNDVFTCGGSILNKTTILSAAHCIYKREPKRMTVRVGNNKRSKQTEKYKVSDIIPHENYDNDTLLNDICIIKLCESIEFRSGAVKPVKLRQTHIGNNETVTISGWGITTESPDPDHLQFINVNTISTVQCGKLFKGNTLPVTDIALCTRTNVGTGACNGDSGGPLVDGNKEQVGIVSWGSSNCANGDPDVYTNVYHYLDWIKAVSLEHMY